MLESCGTDLLCGFLINIVKPMSLYELNLFKTIVFIAFAGGLYYAGFKSGGRYYKEGFINGIQSYLSVEANKKAGLQDDHSVHIEPYIFEAKLRNAKHRELVSSSLFTDYLQMAANLLDNSYKDAAAVIIGSTLENHIKQLCDNSDIPTKNDKGRPIKLDTLNSSLANIEIYSRLDQKNITAWSGLRNDAAHGQYHTYSDDQVLLMLEGVRNFIKRLPA